jgi:mono/diheme cytochrome c family protein
MNSNKKLEDEIKFAELLRNPIRLFGWVLPMFLGIIILLGIYFIKNLNAISINEQNVGLIDSTTIKKEILAKMGSVMPAVDLNVVKSPSPEFIAKGKKIYTTTCQACHGENGMGDGTGGTTLNPKPRNFHETTGWKNGRDIDQLYKTLQEGIPGSGMTAYEYMPPVDRFAVLSYIRTLKTYPDITNEQLTGLDAAYNLSAGTIVPNQIPVAKAERKIVFENVPLMEQYLKFETKLNSSLKDPRAQKLKLYSINLRKVFTCFVRSNGFDSYDKFSASVLSDPIGSGFKPIVTVLSKEEWRNIYDYMKSIIT